MKKVTSLQAVCYLPTDYLTNLNQMIILTGEKGIPTTKQS